MRLESLGVLIVYSALMKHLIVPEILLPNAGVDLAAWAALACDQYTQDRAYWKRAAEARAGKPTTLSLVLPEVFLNDADKPLRVAAIHRAMRDYLASGVFAEPFRGFIYVERSTAYGRKRKGIVAAIDLEAYDWNPAKKAPIRASEATVPERLPPRTEIRRNAPLESPHVMLLANDPKKRLVEASGDRVRAKPPLYSTALLPDSGHITGWGIQDAETLQAIKRALSELEAENTAGGDCLLFAVGDGNHSLAAAKAVWDEYKAQHPADTAHPLRYALVEIVNIYDEGLTFEPIHRVLFGADAGELAAALGKTFGGAVTQDSGGTVFRVAQDAGGGLAVSRLQPVLDSFLAARPAAKIDYIHGEAETLRLTRGAGAAGIILPPVAKGGFFSTIRERGALPRKSFSLGEASEKRFYLECRRIHA